MTAQVIPFAVTERHSQRLRELALAADASALCAATVLHDAAVAARESVHAYLQEQSRLEARANLVMQCIEDKFTLDELEAALGYFDGKLSLHEYIQAMP